MKGVRKPGVIRVQEADELTTAAGEAGVERGALTAVLLEHDLDVVAETLQHSARVVGRPVIHHDDLRLRMGLLQRALDGLRQEPPVVVVVDDDARAGDNGDKEGIDDRSFPHPRARGVHSTCRQDICR